MHGLGTYRPRSIDIVPSMSAKALSERNTKLLENIEMLNEQLVEMNDRQKISQNHYRKIIQDLLVPYKVHFMCMNVYVCLCAMASGSKIMIS